jgi:voltage-gated potassium channel
MPDYRVWCPRSLFDDFNEAFESEPQEVAERLSVAADAFQQLLGVTELRLDVHQPEPPPGAMEIQVVIHHVRFAIQVSFADDNVWLEGISWAHGREVISMDDLRLDPWDRRLAAPMFAATLVLMMLLGATAEWIRWNPDGIPWGIVGTLVAVYGLFAAEFLFHLVRRDPHWRRRLLCCLAPPLRMCGRDYNSPRRVWIPLRGWVSPNPRLVVELERALSLPMIIMALMILPLLAVEHFWAEAIAESSTLRLAVSLATCAIWLAFAVEFFMMIAVVEKKLDYCKRHWLDIVIICLPFVAFLRFLRVGQALRLQQISRVGRVYRLRGLTLRTWRSVLLLDLIARIVRISPEKQLARLRQTLEEKQTELELLRERIQELEREVAAKEAPAKEFSLSEVSEG